MSLRGFRTYTHAKVYRVYVTWVDHGTYVKDDLMTPALKNKSLETGRNIHVTGFRIDGSGDPFKDSVLIPQEIQGSFKVPQIGDIITVEEDYRGIGNSPVYIYSTYNDLPLNNEYSSPIPSWGAMPGDYGHLRSHLDHTSQFSPNAKSSFTKKFIKSVTGYRFRKYYGHVYGTKDRHLDSGKFVVRGDNVFDVAKGDSIMSAEEINSEKGMDIIAVEGNSLSPDQSDYPNPLNVPTFREKNQNYVYISSVPRYLNKQIEADAYKFPEEQTNRIENQRYKVVLKNKNYLSYQPIVDKSYFEYLESVSEDEEGNKPTPFERELPAAEEYQVSLRGNNKLLIQDQYGDGEQLLITLKNHYDAGFTIVHNKENGQVRVRDHLGQGVLLDANPNAPRVTAWTTERQSLDMGSVRSYDPESGETSSFGEYVFIRNGSVYGKSDTSFGRIPDNEIPRDGDGSNDLPQQELVLINSKTNSDFSEVLSGLSSRLSSGMNSFISANLGNGLFFRNNFDPKETNQHFAIFNDFSTQPILTTKMYQEHRNPLNSKTIKSELTQTVQDSESRTYTNNFYQQPGITTNNTVIRKSNADTSENEYSLVGIFPAATSTFSKQEYVLPDSSNVNESNIMLGFSEFTKTRSAKITGLVTETSTYKDLLTLNSVENYIDTSPTTIMTQKIAELKTNKIEMTPTAIITTQYVDDVPYTEVNQTADSIDLNRKIAGLSINLGASGDDVGEGTILLGKDNDIVTVNSKDLTIKGKETIKIISPSVDIDPS